MDPEKEDLIRTLEDLQDYIEEGNKGSIDIIINRFHQNLARNIQLLSELYTSGIRCPTQTDLILAACKYKKADILYFILKDTDILVHLTDASFDDTEVNKQRAEAIKHALTSDDFNMVEMLYDFWCGNLHWNGHDVNNIVMVGNVLQNARDACPDNDEQLQANFHCLVTFNAFQREIYTALAGLKSSDITPKETAIMLLEVLRIYDDNTNIEKIRREHTETEREQAIQANINDESSMYYKNLEYIYYEVYFRKLDLNVSLLILENLFVLRKHLKTRFNKKENYFNANPNMRVLYKNAANTYDGIESAIYHFVYSTTEQWRLYLSEKRQIIKEEYIFIQEGIEKRIIKTLDLYMLYYGPVICLERESFKESFKKLKIILEEHVKREDPVLNDINDNSNVEKLLNENYLQTVSYMRDHYSLIKIVYYIEAIENTTGNNVLMVERVLHVVGEMLKSSNESHHLSRPTQALLQTALSVETISHLRNIRNFLSHLREGELSTRIDMANTQAQRFEKIKKELIMIKEIINPILDIFKSILDKSLLEKGLRLLEQRIEGLPGEALASSGQPSIRRVDYIYQLFKIHKDKKFNTELNKYYKDVWKHTGLTRQLLEEIPWIMQNKSKILEKIHSAKAGVSDKIARILPSLTPYVKQILELIIENINHVGTINQYDPSVQMSKYPDAKEINDIKTKLEKLMKRNKSLKNNVVLTVLNNIKNYKDHWESVKGMLSFCLKECELFAPIKVNVTDKLTATEACNLLTDMEAICVTHRSTYFAWLTGRGAKVLCFKHFKDIEILHNDQIALKIKPADPRLAREILISCLISKLDLLKQTLYPQQMLLSQLVRRYDHDVEFRITVEMVLADIANVLDYCIRHSKPSLMSKSSKLLQAINLGNVLDHGNPFLEVIGDIFNSHDLAAEWLEKAMMFVEDAESIEAVYELFKGDNEECKDDPHAIIGCAGRCHRQCSDYQLASKNWECPHICIPACDCAQGFVYDSYKKICVKPEHCSPEGLEGKD